MMPSVHFVEGECISCHEAYLDDPVFPAHPEATEAVTVKDSGGICVCHGPAPYYYSATDYGPEMRKITC